ncbi:MAG: cob(I)yrinic acid a,c-diamide adenosyltransferase [Rhodospirillaceae bacterium]|nr:cob(I)yrinic acid a,c-diamide adenosyltransferase [Rhodospirillaceae bacterium]
MVKLTKIYTRGGDTGETSLGDGTRVVKHDARVAAYGAVDETNAAVGLARLHTAGLPDDLGFAVMLARIQNELFDLGADLCTPLHANEAPGAALRMTQAQVTRLEHEIDRLNAALSPLTSFVLPAGTAAAAHLHLARTFARRAERDITALAAQAAVNPQALAYINRLSDLLFVMARAANHGGPDAPGDVLWQPGQSRA